MRSGQTALAELEVQPLEAAVFPPAPPCGALALQCRADDGVLIECLMGLHSDPDFARVQSERHVLRVLEGGCHVPLGCHCVPQCARKLLHTCVSCPVRQGAAALHTPRAYSRGVGKGRRRGCWGSYRLSSRASRSELRRSAPRPGARDCLCHNRNGGLA
ncbi:MAG: hypothetical protein H7A22_04650 [Spirochaetales bacterium]|nr:hypothetical protein [Spirochaetales bacterium]